MTKDCVKLYDLSCIYSLYEFTKNNIKEKIWFAEDWGFFWKKNYFTTNSMSLQYIYLFKQIVSYFCPLQKLWGLTIKASNSVRFFRNNSSNWTQNSKYNATRQLLQPR